MDYTITKLVVHLLFALKCGDAEFPKEAFSLPPKDLMPQQCFMQPDLMANQCCIFPPFFKRNISVTCGGSAQFHQFHNHTGQNIALMRRGYRGCNHWRCVLKRYGLIDPKDSNEIVDDVKYFLYLDQWALYNKVFAQILWDAKITCKQMHQVWFPLKACTFFAFQSCIRHYITLNCPSVLDIPVCRQWKVFYAQCHKWYDTMRK